MARKYTAPHEHNYKVLKNLKKLAKKDILRIDTVVLEDDVTCITKRESNIYEGTITLHVTYDGDGIMLTNELMKDFYNVG